jgi:hypothetical protein
MVTSKCESNIFERDVEQYKMIDQISPELCFIFESQSVYTWVSLPVVRSQTLQDLSSDPVTKNRSFVSQHRHVIFSVWLIPVTSVPESVFQTRALKLASNSLSYIKILISRYLSNIFKDSKNVNKQTTEKQFEILSLFGEKNRYFQIKEYINK